MNTELPLYAIAFLVGAVVTTALWFVVVIAEPLTRVWRSATSFGRTAFVASAALLCAYAGIKHPPLLSVSMSPVQDTVSAEDIARGYRPAGVTTNESSAFIIDSQAVRFAPWTLHGARHNWFKADLSGFVFPFGDSRFDAFSVFADGKIRPTPRDRDHEIGLGCENGERVSRPFAALQGISEFGHGQTPDGDYAFIWKDFLELRDNVAAASESNRSVSLGIELKRNGDFTVRSNALAFAYVRVDPCDWDGDGIPNALDPFPRHADGNLFGPDPNLPANANTNAYYTVEIVATGANAEVEFIGDGPSSLADPHFMARSGETCLVSLLMGKAYRVVSSAPITCSNASDAEVEIDAHEDGSFDIVRPVYVYPGNGLHSFAMFIEPDNLAGVFAWTNGCCEIIETSQNTFVFNCNRCRCLGCTAIGYYEYEGYRLETWGGDCFCGYDYDDENQPDGAGLSIPECVYLNNDNERERAGGVEEDDLRSLVVRLPSADYVASGSTVTLACSEGAQRVRLWSQSDRTGEVSLPHVFSNTDEEGETFYLEGIAVSEVIDDVTFELLWTDHRGEAQSIVRSTTVALVTNVIVACDYAGASSNPPPFGGQREWTFDPANSTNVDKHLVVPFASVANPTNFTVRDFDIRLSVELLPAGFSLAGCNAIWRKLGDTPDSGAFTQISGTTALFSNPKVGGIYHLGVTYGGSPQSECNIVLPLAGAEITQVVRADIARADAFVQESGGRLTGRDCALAWIGLKALATPLTANYLGRADNTDHPTVWKYNQVDTNGSIRNLWRYGGGCVATVAGIPTRIAKMTNLLTGYASEELGASTTQQAWGQLPGTDNDSTSLMSWMAGVEISRFGDFDIRLSQFARWAWTASDDPKVRALWPNVHAVDNHRLGHPYSSPDYDRNFYSPRYLNDYPSAFRESYEDMNVGRNEEQEGNIE